MIGQSFGSGSSTSRLCASTSRAWDAAPYCAAKGGFDLPAQVLALERAEYGVTANSVAPGEIATP
ncbi:SDR family NAD(P)-dependent oxidoreductase [Streptomyces sp. NBC_00316]|uniref:SDR family NAD(P)-dependent oxidoreductase n=1 Tax=Streptomyces sp. NBC_00316 TaxID=2975710 RepID=UPI002E2B2A48|nr:SDR family NAD(P)-dependent oxidoreductase [Streptomyces sp. NBC_00316]